MSKLEIIALSGLVCKEKNTGPSTEPCGTPYESVTLSDRVSLKLLRMVAYFANEKKTKFHTNQKVYLLMVNVAW